ncbi:MAG TPA: RDD family protein [Candidatus Stackebrandtia excrementipullorum]|nr:RDD family protein [Candidatus Stackebrandtia excrementipullorum]
MTTGETAVSDDDIHDVGPAGLGQRFLALLADWLLCLLIAGGLVRIGALATTQPDALFGPEQVWPSLILALEYAFFLSISSQTPGMRLLRIHCVGFHDGRRLGLWRAALRGLLLALVLPVLTVFVDPNRRGLHDLAAGSIVARQRTTSGS